jgi:hypothetical protein
MITAFKLMLKERQGVMILWKSHIFTKLAQIEGRYTLTVDLSLNMDDTVIRFTAVYEPIDANDRQTFFTEL